MSALCTTVGCLWTTCGLLVGLLVHHCRVPVTYLVNVQFGRDTTGHHGGFVVEKGIVEKGGGVAAGGGAGGAVERVVVVVVVVAGGGGGGFQKGRGGRGRRGRRGRRGSIVYYPLPRVVE